MRIAEAYKLFGDGVRLAWRSLRTLTLHKAGLRSAVGAFVRPLTAPSRYPEYATFFDLLGSSSIDLSDPGSWLLDVGSPKLFSVLLASRTGATVLATDIWPPAIKEAEGLRGGLNDDASKRFRTGVANICEPLPQGLLPPGGKFAGAFSMSVIEHIDPDPGGDIIALRRIADVVRPSGHIIVSVPVDRVARSDYLHSEMYGRSPVDERGRFFQRVYDGSALRALCTAMSSVLVFEKCIIIEWPDHLLMDMLPKFPSVLGFAGSTFPLLANRFKSSQPSATIPEIQCPGDAILTFRRSE